MLDLVHRRHLWYTISLDHHSAGLDRACSSGTAPRHRLHGWHGVGAAIPAHGHSIARYAAGAHRSGSGGPAGADRHGCCSEHADRADPPEATRTKARRRRRNSRMRSRRSYGDYKELRLETVGPTVGASVSKNSIISVLRRVGRYSALSRVGIPQGEAAVSLRVRARSSPCCMMCFVVLGIFAILGKITGTEIDSLFVTALLTVIGFSVHDTIVVFDRIRENQIRRPAMPFDDVVNYSLNQTIVRSINTSLTVDLHAARALPLRWRDDPRVRPRAADRRRQRHVLVHLQREPIARQLGAGRDSAARLLAARRGTPRAAASGAGD